MWECYFFTMVSTKIKKTKIVCMSHEEDADGISSAALIKQAFGGETILADYPGMMDAMEPLRDDKKLKEFYICDLGLNAKNENECETKINEACEQFLANPLIEEYSIKIKSL